MRRALVAVVVFSGALQAWADNPLCLVLGAAANYRIVAPKGVVARAGSDFGQNPIGNVFGSICTSKLKQQATEVDDEDFQYPAPIVVALASRGVAIRLLRSNEYAFPDNTIAGNIATGGGKVAGELVDFYGYTIDTSGTHPALANCAQAMADIRAASATIAAYPPTHTFGAVRIRTDETLTIDVTGGAVIQMDSLQMDAVDGRSYGYQKSCEGIYGSGHSPAELDLLGNYGDVVVINVGRLALGGCTRFIFNDGLGTPTVLINAPGKGQRIVLGPAAGTDSSPALLAPDRSLWMTGSPDFDSTTQLARAWVKNVRTVGGTGIPLCCYDGFSCP